MAWASAQQDGSGLGVYAQRFCPSSPPSITNLSVRELNGGASLWLTWSNVSGASDYAVYEDTQPCGSFGALIGTATNGAAGLIIPTPSGNRFYSVVGRSGSCIGLRR